MSRLDDLLFRVRRRWFATVALRTFGVVTAAAAIPALAALLLDWQFSPDGASLIMLAAVAAALSAGAGVLVLVRVERRPDDRRVARFVEERAAALPGVGPLDDSVVSAVDARESGRERAAVAALIVASATRKLEGVTPAQLVTPEDLRRAASVAIAGGTLLLSVIVAGIPSLGRAAETARLRLFPESVTLEVTPGNARLVAGRPLKIRARPATAGKRVARVAPELIVSAGGDRRAVPMKAAGDGFEFDFESVDRTFEYRVTLGSASSRDYTVTALFPPRVTRIDLRYEYPSFSGLSPRDEQDGGDIYAPAGTRVRVRVHTDKRISSGELALGSARIPVRSAGDRSVEADLVLSKDDSYRVRLADHDGITSEGDSEYFIRLMDDRPPDVRILRPSADQAVTPLEEITIEARADDDYGVAALELVYSIAGGREHAVPFSRITGTQIQKVGSHLLAAEELKVKPGDVIAYYARALDIGRGKRATETKSDLFFLEVKPFSEEFVAAQSQGSAGSGDPQLDSLISSQKEIINATWNIERRSQVGRSAADIAAIARAQAELKARAERLAGGGSLGRRFREPEPPAPLRRTGQQRGGSREGAASAIEAMARALEQLGAARTREALPHQMAALNALLQAQAEVRRRQVTQQSAGAGNAGNRSGQDLSALFDKELQRQQRTNYEPRSRVEPREDRQADDALDRVKELARRQEELNRRHRDLEKMSGDERGRELEKLTRDQEELRKEADDLARRAGRQSGMRDAADQMRAAAGDMRRDHAAAAQQSGQRAADRLRRVEQQLRGGSASAMQREAGELRSEAQQIAQEQRRIASEAGRLDKGGGSSGDARRRLADEKDRLAARVDELRRAAQQQARDDPRSEQASSAREAAAELERQRVADRLRESARQMRSGNPTAQGLEGTEQQISRSLDRVVDRLGGGSSAEARRLAQELDRTRQLRDRLDRLEKEMRQAEGKRDGQLAKLRQQYEQELRQARESLGRQEGVPRNGLGTSTPQQHEFSRSAPGTEAFKQDRSNWDTLRKDVDRALEQYDAAVSRRLASRIAEARLSAGGSDQVPEEYRRFIARYYESLSRAKK